MQAKATKPDLSLEGFLASSAPLEVQLQRAKHKGTAPVAGQSFEVGWAGGLLKGVREKQEQAAVTSRHQKRHTIGTLDALRAQELVVNDGTGSWGTIKEEDTEEEPKPKGILGFLSKLGKRPSQGDNSEILKAIAIDKYIKNQTLRDQLENGDTVLVKGSWLVRRWKMGKSDGLFGLPRRQELQERHPDSLWKVDELFDLKAKGIVNIVAVSHCWLGSQHPDPQGTQLDTLCTVVDLMLRSTPLEDLALFIDYCSLYQLPRTPQQEAGFTRAFPHTHLWYLHQGTRVWMLTKVNPKAERSESFDQRGWPNLERGLADMVTKNNFLLDLGKLDDSCTNWQKLTTVCKYTRSVPRLPHEFNEELERAVFAVEEDRPFCMMKYDEGFLEAIAAAEELSFSDLGWGDDEARALANMLPHCGRLTKLALHGNKLTEKGVKILIGVLSKCPLLDQLWLTANTVSKAKKEVREEVIEAWVKTGRLRERLRM